VTILPGAINEGEKNTHHPTAFAAIPQANPSTTAVVQGPAQAPPVMSRLPSLALCRDGNTEGMALEGGGSPRDRGGQKEAGQLATRADTQNFWARNTLCTEGQPWGMERRQKGWNLLLLSGSSVTDCTTRIHLPGFGDPLLGSGKS